MTKKAMTFVAKNSGIEMLGFGNHKVTITKVSETSSKPSDEYGDVTPQIEVQFKGEKGSIRAWYNLKGYKKDEKTGKYLLDKKGNRIEDPENTETAISIFTRLAYHAGIAENVEFEIEDLVDLEVGINVAPDNNGQARVKRSMTLEKLEETINAPELDA